MTSDKYNRLALARTPEQCIARLRGQSVILDIDLAALYGVTVKRLNEQVKRNAQRFPEDFIFQLTEKEWTNLKSQFATSSDPGGLDEPIFLFFARFAIFVVSSLPAAPSCPS